MMHCGRAARKCWATYCRHELVFSLASLLFSF